MRVLHVLTRSVGGAAQQVAYLTAGLAGAGHGSHVLCGVDTASEGAVAIPGVQVVPQLRRGLGPRDFAALRALRALINAGAADVLHTHQSKAGVLGRLAARNNGVSATVHTFHGPSLRSSFPSPVAASFLAVERKLAATTSALVADSTALRDELLGDGVGRPEQWSVVPNAVDVQGLRSRLVEQSVARATLGLPVGAPVIGAMGRLAPVKGFELFIEVARRVSALIPDVHFVIGGQGALEARLRRLAERDGARMRLVGHVDPALFLSAVDVLVLTSRYEGTPLVLIEAAAAGVPVVAADVGGVREVVEHGRTGVLVDRDGRAITDAVAALVRDPGRAAKFGAAAVVHAQSFGVPRLVERVTEVYQKARVAAVR